MGPFLKRWFFIPKTTIDYENDRKRNKKQLFKKGAIDMKNPHGYIQNTNE